MISCIIIEDQAPAQRILQRYIGDIDYLQLEATFSDALSALEFLKTNRIDLIFLDIHLPKISGINFLNILSPRPQVILTTAFSEYALQGYELEITDYLLKPFSFERFLKAVNKIESQHSANSPASSSSNADFIFIKPQNDYIKVNIKDIRYIKTEGNYTYLYINQQKYLLSNSLKYWTQKLPASLFVQIHKSYMVNIAHIQKVSGNQIILNDITIPIGRAYKEQFVELYLKK